MTRTKDSFDKFCGLVDYAIELKNNRLKRGQKPFFNLTPEEKDALFELYKLDVNHKGAYNLSSFIFHQLNPDEENTAS